MGKHETRGSWRKRLCCAGKLEPGRHASCQETQRTVHACGGGARRALGSRWLPHASPKVCFRSCGAPMAPRVARDLAGAKAQARAKAKAKGAAQPKSLPAVGLLPKAPWRLREAAAASATEAVSSAASSSAAPSALAGASGPQLALGPRRVPLALAGASSTAASSSSQPVPKVCSLDRPLTLPAGDRENSGWQWRFVHLGDITPGDPFRLFRDSSIVDCCAA